MAHTDGKVTTVTWNYPIMKINTNHVPLTGPLDLSYTINWPLDLSETQYSKRTAEYVRFWIQNYLDARLALEVVVDVSYSLHHNSYVIHVQPRRGEAAEAVIELLDGRPFGVALEKAGRALLARLRPEPEPDRSGRIYQEMIEEVGF